jgi:hypothetical protein
VQARKMQAKSACGGVSEKLCNGKPQKKKNLQLQSNKTNKHTKDKRTT